MANTFDTKDKVEEFLELVLTQIKKQHPEFKTVEISGGVFTKEGLARVAAKAPALYLAWGNQELKTGACKPKSLIVLSLAVACKDRRGLKRATHLIRSVGSISKQIQDNRWGLAGCLFVDNVRSINLETESLAKQGITLASINWKQRILV